MGLVTAIPSWLFSGSGSTLNLVNDRKIGKLSVYALKNPLRIPKVLFAGSLLGIARTFLEQMQQDELRILSCITLLDFMNNDKKQAKTKEFLILHLRSSGMQALACMGDV